MRNVQFSQHDEMWFVRVYRPAFIHQLKRHLGRIQKDEALADKVEVGDATSPRKINMGLA